MLTFCLTKLGVILYLPISPSVCLSMSAIIVFDNVTHLRSHHERQHLDTNTLPDAIKTS